jgi:hypothetical protein
MYVWAIDHRGIIVDGSICGCFQGGMTGTSSYVLNCVVCFQVFLQCQCLLYEIRCVSKNKKNKKKTGCL